MKIQSDSHITELIVSTNIIIWDEAPMVDRYYFKAVDRSLRDILCHIDPKNIYKFFEENVILLDGVLEIGRAHV